MPERHRRTVRRHVHIGPRALATLGAAAAIIGGCGSSSAPTESQPVAQSEGIAVAALGDSITAGNPAFDPDPDQRAALGFGEDEQSQYEYWAEQQDPRLRFLNCGVFGERTDEIAQRLDECAAAADALVIQGGINDIAQQRPVADAADDLRSMVARGNDLGLDVYLVDVLPWNNGHPLADRPIAELNRRIAAIGEQEDVPVIGFHDQLEDPDAPGQMSPQLTADGDHPSVAGYRMLGELVASRLAGAGPG